MYIVWKMHRSTTRRGMFRSLGSWSLLGPCRITGILNHLSGLDPCVALEDSHSATSRLGFATDKLWRSMNDTVICLRILGCLYAYGGSPLFQWPYFACIAYILWLWGSTLFCPVRSRVPPSDIRAFHISRIGANGIAADENGATYKVANIYPDTDISEAAAAFREAGLQYYVAVRVLHSVSSRSAAG